MRKLFLLFLSPLFLSCSSPSTNEIKSGTKFQIQYIKDFYPKPKIGMKYVYLSSEKKGLAQVLNRLEYTVSEINSNNLKLKSLVNSKDEKTIDLDLNNPPLLPKTDYLYEGKEFLTVIAGSYLTTRFSYLINNDRYDLWISDDVGIIKYLERKSSGDVILTELNEFRF